MPDLKSMLPDLKEITSMATKLFNDIRKSVGEIVDEYKQNHPTEESQASVPTKEDVESNPKHADIEKSLHESSPMPHSADVILEDERIAGKKTNGKKAKSSDSVVLVDNNDQEQITIRDPGIKDETALPIRKPAKNKKETP